MPFGSIRNSIHYFFWIYQKLHSQLHLDLSETPFTTPFRSIRNSTHNSFWSYQQLHSQFLLELSESPLITPFGSIRNYIFQFGSIKNSNLNSLWINEKLHSISLFGSIRLQSQFTLEPSETSFSISVWIYQKFNSQYPFGSITNFILYSCLDLSETPFTTSFGSIRNSIHHSFWIYQKLYYSL